MTTFIVLFVSFIAASFYGVSLSIAAGKSRTPEDDEAEAKYVADWLEGRR